MTYEARDRFVIRSHFAERATHISALVTPWEALEFVRQDRAEMERLAVITPGGVEFAAAITTLDRLKSNIESYSDSFLVQIRADYDFLSRLPQAGDE